MAEGQESQRLFLGCIVMSSDSQDRNHGLSPDAVSGRCWFMVGVCGADDGEVAPVQRGDPLLVVAFGQGDEAGVGATQA